MLTRNPDAFQIGLTATPRQLTGSREDEKISADNLESYKPITTPSDIAGVPYEVVKTVQDVSPYPAVAQQGVEQLDKVDETTAAVLLRTAIGSRDLQTIALP